MAASVVRTTPALAVATTLLIDRFNQSVKPYDHSDVNARGIRIMGPADRTAGGSGGGRGDPAGGPRRGPRGRSDGGTREQVVQAALDTLRSDGFANASARTIARTGGFTPALIFYYFGSLDGLLLAALDATSEAQWARYEPLVNSSASLEELATSALALYREDLEAGHVTVVAELVGAGIARPALRQEIANRAERWADLAEAAIGRAIKDSPLADLLSPRDLATAVITGYLGLHLFHHMDPDGTRIDALFGLARRVAPLIAPMLSTQQLTPPPSRSPEPQGEEGGD
jgi:AcrR family transcriptional regulator